MKIKKSVVALAAATVALCGAPVASAQNLSSALSSALPGILDSVFTNPGVVESYESVSVPGQGVRSYKVQVPANLNGRVDLVYGFGGMGHDSEWAESYMQFDKVTRGQAIIVYPEPTMGRNGQLAWEGPNYASTSRGQDVAFLQAIDKQLRAKYTVGKSYGAGLSNGGGMVMAAACQAPELFDAVVGVATANYHRIYQGCHGFVPTMFVHGTNDDIAPFNRNGSNGHGGGYYSTRESFRRVGERNLCDTNNPAMTSHGSYDVFSMNRCAADTKMLRLNGGGHTWFQDAAHGVDATQEAWNFFRAH